MSPILVRDIMTTPVISLFEEQTLPLADDIMRYKHIRHLPVTDDQRRLVGLVSHRDILGARTSLLEPMSAATRRATDDAIRVKDVMSRELWTTSPDSLASVAGQRLLDHRFSCLPVVDHDFRLIGIVTDRDYLAFAIRALGEQDVA
jgi:CBS domain-containing membrane protein